MTRGKGVWSIERDAQLAKLWDDGLSSNEIGRRLGITKNSALGRIHRLKLEPRRSPIHRHSSAEKAAMAQARAIKRAAKLALPNAIDPIGSGAEIALRGSPRQKWTEAEMVRIHALIRAGASLADIGRDFELARETVRCRFKRLGLTTRWEPAVTRRTGAGKVVKTTRVTPVARQHASGSAARVALVGVTLPGLQVETVKHTAPVAVGRVRQCEFLSGERYHRVRCDAPVVGKKPYCAEHCAICYVPERAREMGEAA